MKRPLLAVCLFLVLLTAVRIKFGLEDDSKTSDSAGLFDRESLTVTGQVYRKEKDVIYLKNISVLISDASQQKKIPLKENLIYSTEKENSDERQSVLEEPLMGQRIMLSGIFQSFQKATNPGEFDSAAYYRTFHIAGKLTDVTLLAAGSKYAVFSESLYRVKRYLERRLYSILPKKEASIMSTMLLGEKAGLDSETKELYQRNGIIHILSISGLHITMIGMGVYKLLRKAGLKPWKSAVSGAVLLILYGALTGMSVSACRAIIMYGLRMLGKVWGRTYDMLTALSVAGAVTAFLNPLYLYHAGFLLSYGAVLGVSVIYPAILPRKKRVLKKYVGSRVRALLQNALQEGKTILTESICVSAAIILATLPIQLWFYYETPVYAVLLNLCVLPFMKIVVMAGMTAMLVPGLGWLAVADMVILAGYEKLCLVCDGLPFHIWNPGKPEIWQVICYYAVLGVVIWIGKGKGRKIDAKSRKSCVKEKMKVRKRKVHVEWLQVRLAGMQIVLLTMAVVLLGVQWDKSPRVTFLDVGQGDCICVEDAAGGVYLFDCGSSSRSKVGNYVLLPFLKQAGISRVDALFISHADSDHINGAAELLQMGASEGITVERLVLPDIKESEKAVEFEALLQEAGVTAQGRQLVRRGQTALLNPERNIVVQYVKAGDVFRGKGIEITCLHPPKGYAAAEGNAYSECFLVEFPSEETGEDAFRLLFTGDVDGEGEELLISELQRKGISKVDVLKVAHHGSSGTTSEAFLSQIKPDAAVISCGENNRYGHPHKELLERLIKCGTQIYQTKDSGAVTVQIGGKK